MDKTSDLSYSEINNDADTTPTGEKQSRHILKGLMEDIFPETQPTMRNKTHTVYKRGSVVKGEDTNKHTKVPQLP